MPRNVPVSGTFFLPGPKATPDIPPLPRSGKLRRHRATYHPLEGGAATEIGGWPFFDGRSCKAISLGLRKTDGQTGDIVIRRITCHEFFDMGQDLRDHLVGGGFR